MSINPQPAKFAASKAFNFFNLVVFTIGAKLANVINVACQLQDARGQSIAGVAHCSFYLSDNADGSTLTATALTSALAIGTKGVLIDSIVTEKAGDVLSDVTGKFDINLTQTASPQTYYFCVQMPDGSVVVSPIITF